MPSFLVLREGDNRNRWHDRQVCPDGGQEIMAPWARRSVTRGLLETDHVIWNHGQVTWTTPELAPPSPNYHTPNYQLSTDLTCIAALHGGSLVVLDSNS
ncbi:hypothetical protein TNCV_671511 [Trichonephila clavipes]|nr:hypothetical protein TNCV_671511 [Trichonephila clavipes]